ncbi:MAG: DUF4434 domain-containing protein, partial [Bacteroidia bacterium]|nr:DUF4434 domain-containing protein [Bacteroidia bacterium]
MHTEKNNRRDFIKKTALAGASIAVTSSLAACTGNNRQGATTNSPGSVRKDESLKSTLIVPKNNGLQITGAFLDEISHDIPHQNWGEAEWDLDFQYMKAIGID